MGDKPTSSSTPVVPDDEMGPARRPLRAQENTIDIVAQGGDTRAPGGDDDGLGEMPPMPKRVGGFSLIEPLGMGGMGHVYLARQDSLERLVALKVLRNQLAKDKIYLERFQREAKAAALFSHPHVVSVIDTGHDRAEDLYYIAFEYVDGGSLESLVRAKGPIPERRALEITRAIALALQFAESRRLVHRDLKPANILLAADGTPKLADLGLVRQAERGVGPQVTQEGVILGTPLYMAPEQALGREIDVRADIYSLGLCLYRMLTGRIPFNEAEDTCSTLAILSRHVNEELPDVRDIVGGVSEATVRLIADMTQREVALRYRSAAHVAQEIDRLLAKQPLLGARAMQCSTESEAPTTAITGIRPEDLVNKKPDDSTQRGPGPADSTPTVAAPVVVLPAPPQGAGTAGSPPAGAPAAGGAAPASPAPALRGAPGPGKAPPAATGPQPPPPRGGSGSPLVVALSLGAVASVVLMALALRPRPAGPDVGKTGTTTTTARATEGPAPTTATTPPATEPGPGGTTTATDVRPTPDTEPPATTESPPVATETPVEPLPPLDPPPASTEPPTVTEPAPPAGRDPVAEAIEAAGGDPDKIALLVRDVSRELFVDVPRGREHAAMLVERSGWSPSPMRDRFAAAAQAFSAALEQAVPGGWDERQRRLQQVALITRERMHATELERLKAAVDAELQRWNLFATNANRVRLALGDPRTEEQVLRAFDPLPEDFFVREDARALLAMGRAADQPDRWVRIEERRAEVADAVRELRDRIERTALALVVAEEALVVARVLERQLQDPHASFPTALVRTWNEGSLTVPGGHRDPKDSLFLQARRREVPRGAPWTNLPGWALMVELGSPLEGGGGVTVTINDKMTVHLGSAGVVVGGTFLRCHLAGAKQVLIEPRFDGLLLRMPGGAPEELMIPLPEGPVVPVRFSARAQGEADVTRLVLVRLPDRVVNSSSGGRHESMRRQRQGR